MGKMWAGRTSGDTSELADELNSSIAIDCRMYRQDIKGSIAHAKMLAKQNIIADEEAESIISGLNGILNDIEAGRLKIDENAEDIHMFIEEVLTKRIGNAGKKVHTARSRNDQVALDTRLYLRDEIDEFISLIDGLLEVLTEVAEKNTSVIMPGYTHLQRAQPILFSHQMLAYAMMLLRDRERLFDARKRINISPIGSCALAGTTYSTDRDYEAELLDFDMASLNSIDSVSDRDFVLELMSCLSILQMHMSRLAEELIIWSSWEFRFIEFSDSFTTGSSIMPQKKNPDMAELIRGKTGRVYGDMMTLFTALKGLPLAYNKDMQEDKEAVFDACDTVKLCLKVLTPMLREMKINQDKMLDAANGGFINATDLADYLVRQGAAFRDAYKISGGIVAECIRDGFVLENYPLERYRMHSSLIESDVYDAVNLRTCVEKRISKGGTSLASVNMQIEYIKDQLKIFKSNS